MGRGPSTYSQCTVVTITFRAHRISRCVKCFLPARTHWSHLTNMFFTAHCIYFRLHSLRALLLRSFSSNMSYKLKNWIERVYVWQTKKLQSLVHHFVTWWRSWLRHCATSRKVAGSIPDGVGIFHWHNPSGRTMDLGLTQPIAEMSTSNISWGVKVAGT